MKNNIKFPYALLDQSGPSDGVKFTIKKDGSGIELEKFKIGQEQYTCTIIQYKGKPLYRAIKCGKIKLGAAQAGVYKIKGEKEKTKKVALIMDYMVYGGGRRIYVERIAKNEEEMRTQILSLIKTDGYHEYMDEFSDYWRTK